MSTFPLDNAILGWNLGTTVTQKSKQCLIFEENNRQ